MRQLIVSGYLKRDPESRALQSGKTVCTFSIDDVKKTANGKDDHFWVKVSAWGRLGETCLGTLRQGSYVIVVGEPSLRAYTDQSGKTRTDLEIFATSVEPIQSTGGGYQQAHQQQPYNGGYQQQPQQQYAQPPYNPPQNGGQAAPPPPADDQGDSPF